MRGSRRGVLCVCSVPAWPRESSPLLPVHGSPQREERGCIAVWERQKCCILKCELLQGPRSLALPLVLFREGKIRQCSVSMRSVELGLGVPATLWLLISVLETGTPLPCPCG